MKYSDLISFNPIEDVIQLTTADDANRAKEYVKSYVMSDTMAANLKSPVLDQLQMDEVVDNKGVLVVGNYGTGKSHLMSVISSIAKDADNLQYLQNKNFAKEMECIAGKFEVLRIEIGGVTMSLREILFGFIEDDFAARGIDFDELEETLSSLKQEKENLIRSLEVLDQQPKALLHQDFTQNLSKLRDLQPREQSIFLQQYIDKITVFAPKGSNEKAEVEIYIQSNIVQK